MALLTGFARDPRRPAALGLVVLLAFAGCVLVDALVRSDRPFAFNHRLHVEDEGLECTDCHGKWDSDEEPGMPLPAQCALCHAEIDREKPPELRVASLFDGNRYRAAHAGRLDDEIQFSHQQHAARTGCIECHAKVAGDEGDLARRVAELRTSMDDCLACHARTSASAPPGADCAACHAAIRAGAAPPNHNANWLRYHGTVVRARGEGRSDQCALCHQPAECTTCHQVELPANHDNYWRRRGHGLVASMDRDNCATCHDTDSCQRCHAETRPLGHTGGWGAPRDRHCVSCHEPLASTSCAVCHEDTSSHAAATPLPDDHLPGMNCRQCHGNGQPLPHTDNGQSCTSCHE